MLKCGFYVQITLTHRQHLQFTFLSTEHFFLLHLDIRCIPLKRAASSRYAEAHTSRAQKGKQRVENSSAIFQSFCMKFSGSLDNLILHLFKKNSECYSHCAHPTHQLLNCREHSFLPLRHEHILRTIAFTGTHEYFGSPIFLHSMTFCSKSCEVIRNGAFYIST